MKKCDPAITPPADEWLAKAEAERIGVVEAFHLRERVKLPSPTLHATIHVMVENQIALGERVEVDTFGDAKNPEVLERLRRYEGPKNTADLNAASELVLPDLREFSVRFQLVTGGAPEPTA